MARKKTTRKVSQPAQIAVSRPGEGDSAAITRDALNMVNVSKGRVLNCIGSLKQEEDWTIETARQAELIEPALAPPATRDLRAAWWNIRDQDQTGACVGFATADGVLRWHYVQNRAITQNQQTSPRFIWMADKETDEITDFPTTFIESAGTQVKLALGVARRYGCVLEKDLPMGGPLYGGSTVSFYMLAARLRIRSYFNLGTSLANWRFWIGTQGPVLTRLNCDDSWMNADANTCQLKRYPVGALYGGHAVALVGYTKDYFIVRNSWGTDWGGAGFAYAWNSYAEKAFTEAYGVVP